MSPEIILLLSPDTASAITGESAENSRSRCIREAMQELHVSIRQMHPGIRHGQLACYFRILPEEPADAEKIVERLAACPGVKAAYSKPAAEPAIGGQAFGGS
jgi:hypothetical protein